MDMHTQIFIGVSAANAWQLLADKFGDIGDYVTVMHGSSVDRTPGVGAVRTCNFGRGQQATEVLTEFDPDAMVFTYAATSGLPRSILEAKNCWSVEALGPNRCCVHSRAHMHLVWWLRPLAPLMRVSMRPMMKRIGEELSFALEQGKPHPRKVAALAKA